MQHFSLFIQVAGLEEKWVEVKRHAAEVPEGTRTSLDEALSCKEAQRLHVLWSYEAAASGYKAAFIQLLASVFLLLCRLFVDVPSCCQSLVVHLSWIVLSCGEARAEHGGSCDT